MRDRDLGSTGLHGGLEDSECARLRLASEPRANLHRGHRPWSDHRLAERQRSDETTFRSPGEESRLPSHSLGADSTGKAQCAPSFGDAGDMARKQGRKRVKPPALCALRADASYNYLLVDGNRRLTPRELFRLQGFPESFVLPKTDAAARRLSGNSVPVPTVRALIQNVLLRCASRQTTIAV